MFIDKGFKIGDRVIVTVGHMDNDAQPGVKGIIDVIDPACSQGLYYCVHIDDGGKSWCHDVAYDNVWGMNVLKFRFV